MSEKHKMPRILPVGHVALILNYLDFCRSENRFGSINRLGFTSHDGQRLSPRWTLQREGRIPGGRNLLFNETMNQSVAHFIAKTVSEIRDSSGFGPANRSRVAIPSVDGSKAVRT